MTRGGRGKAKKNRLDSRKKGGGGKKVRTFPSREGKKGRPEEPSRINAPRGEGGKERAVRPLSVKPRRKGRRFPSKKEKGSVPEAGEPFKKGRE